MLEPGPDIEMRLVLSVLLLGALYLGVRIAIAQLATVSSAEGPVLDDGPPRLADCPDTPNCQSSFARDETQRVAPLTLSPDVPLDGLMQRMTDRLSRSDRVTVASMTEDYAHLVYRSAVFGFPDDVELLLDTDRRVIQIRSASRLGHSDLGANRKRVERIREALSPLLTGAP